MSFIVAVAEWSLLAFGLLLLVAQLLVNELGYWWGQRAARKADVGAEGVGVIVGGMLGLLAFVLALTLSFASDRFAERRAGTLAESNAIGTAWLRAEAVDNPRGEKIARLLEEYTAVRKAFIAADLHATDLGRLNQQTNTLQNQMWGHMTAIVREAPGPISASLMASLNDVFDMSTAVRFAYDFRVPPQIFWLLIGMTMLGMTGLGFQLGLKGRPTRLLVVLLTAMWTIVIVDILDLAAARVGSFRTSTAVYEWTQQGLGGKITIPPMPARP